MKYQHLLFMAGYLFLLSISGCGDSLVPLEGTVTLDGKPLAGAKTLFQRSEGPVNERAFMAETDKDGHYAVRPSWNDRQGIVPGKYQVFISSVTIPADAPDTAVIPDDPIPVRYRDGTEWITISEKGNREANFEMRQ